MKYPKLLQAGDAIGVCAPSAGMSRESNQRLDNAAKNVTALGYKVIETPSVRSDNSKCVSALPEVRADEFMSLYENPDVAAIIPPWGGEFLMDMLPLLNFELLAYLPPKWICGYSDITTLTFPITLMCDIATIHGSNFANMGYASIHESDIVVFDAMIKAETEQNNFPFHGGFNSYDITKQIYNLDKPTEYKLLKGSSAKFAGAIIGGCLDVLCKLIGTKYAPAETFINKYKHNGIIWTLESCEMNAGDIYRTLWQMQQCGWFAHCSGILIGRADGYRDTGDFTLVDALENTVGKLGVPVIYDCDIGHIPPQLQLVNGSYATAEYDNGSFKLTQSLKL